MAMPKRMLIDRLNSYRSAMAEAKGKYKSAAEWRGFDDWHSRVHSLLNTYFKRQWPNEQFRNLSFEPPPRYNYDPHMGRSLAPADPAEAAEFFSRAADEAVSIFANMIEHVDDLLRPEPEKAIPPPASVTIHAHTIDGSAFQIGTVGSSQYQSALKAHTETLKARLLADSHLGADRQSEIEPLLAAISAAHSDRVIEELVLAVARIVGHSSKTSDQAFAAWGAATGKMLDADPTSIPIELVTKRLPQLRDELIAASRQFETADQWQEFERWYDETLTLLEGAFGAKSWQRNWFSAVQFHSPDSHWRQPEETPRLMFTSLARTLQESERRVANAQADRKYFQTAIPRALRALEDVLSSLTATT